MSPSESQERRPGILTPAARQMGSQDDSPERVAVSSDGRFSRRLREAGHTISGRQGKLSGLERTGEHIRHARSEACMLIPYLDIDTSLHPSRVHRLQPRHACRLFPRSITDDRPHRANSTPSLPLLPLPPPLARPRSDRTAPRRTQLASILRRLARMESLQGLEGRGMVA